MIDGTEKPFFFRIAKRAGDPTNLAVKDLVLLTASFQMFVIFPSYIAAAVCKSEV